MASKTKLVGAIDQGTSSSRFLVRFFFSFKTFLIRKYLRNNIVFKKIFNTESLDLITYHQETIEIKTPNPGWVEQDAYEILNKTILCMERATERLEKFGYNKSDIKGTTKAKKEYERIFKV